MRGGSRRRSRTAVVLVVGVVLALAAFSTYLVQVNHVRSSGGGPVIDDREEKQDQGDVSFALNEIPYFTKNEGQLRNEDVLYYSPAGPIQIGLARSALLLKLTEGPKSPIDSKYLVGDDFPTLVPGRIVILQAKFNGVNDVGPTAFGEMPHHSNFLFGSNPEMWLTDVPSYRGVVYPNLYNGIDGVYTAEQYGARYEFIVHPGADPSLIELSYEGVSALDLVSGRIVMRTPIGEIYDSRPFAYQGLQSVDCEFVILGRTTYGFRCSDWDRTRTLVIDPEVYSTYLGGGSSDCALDVVADSAGNAYVTGWTESIDFPTTPGTYDVSYGGQSDVFVAKLNSTLGALVYSTYLGGSDIDRGFSIDVDSVGNAYITGDTYSTDFPTVSTSFDTSYNGDGDAYVAKLNAMGNGLLYSTYVGGESHDRGQSMEVDELGHAHVAGHSNSHAFPTTPGAFDTSFNGYDDVVVLELDDSGSHLIYSTFVGGNNLEQGLSMDLDSAGNVYVTGNTWSTDFPTTTGAYDRTFNGGIDDAFVFKLEAGGGGLYYSTFLGGTEEDEGLSVVVDSVGSAFVAGQTNSADFPVTPDIIDATFNGTEDGFVTKLDATGGTILFSTFLGGSDYDRAFSIAVDKDGGPLVVGESCSNDFPATSGAFDTTYNGDCDGFLTRFNPTASLITYSTFVGGVKEDWGGAMDLKPSGDTYVAGLSRSLDFPITPQAFDRTFNGVSDTFIMKFPAPNKPPTVLSFAVHPAPSLEGQVVTLEVNASDPDGDPLTYEFDFNADGIYDFAVSNDTVTHVYGDDFNGTAVVRVSDGNLSTTTTARVSVLNVQPTVLGDATARVEGDITLRVAGEKWHDVVLTICEDGVAVAIVSITRVPGSPDDQAVTIRNVTIDLLRGNYSATVLYTPPDDPINGQPNGANPAWLTFTAKDGSESKIHHTFNVRHNDTWIWRVDDLRALAAGMNITFAATATDPGSDDLTFIWEWGDGSLATAKTYYNDGIGSDPYPSPDGTFPFTATDSQVHPYAVAGTYNLVLRIIDDDGGAGEMLLVIVLV